MFKLMLIPFLLLFVSLFLIVIVFIVYRKVKRGVKYTVDKSSKISSQYINKWRNQEQRKKLPPIVQKGFDNYQSIEDAINKLPPMWQLKLMPLKQKSNNLLVEISHNLTTDETFERSKFNSVRSFFNHSLDALKQLSQKLVSDHKTLSKDETERAKENIIVIYNDLIRHEKTLSKTRKFEFDVLMDVIKARLKS